MALRRTVAERIEELDRMETCNAGNATLYLIAKPMTAEIFMSGAPATDGGSVV